jgi:hypothetical protein
MNEIKTTSESIIPLHESHNDAPVSMMSKT